MPEMLLMKKLIDIGSHISVNQIAKFLIAITILFGSYFVAGLGGAFFTLSFMLMFLVVCGRRFIENWIVALSVTTVAILLCYQVVLGFGLQILNSTKIVQKQSPLLLTDYPLTPYDYSYRFNEFTQSSSLILIATVTAAALAVLIRDRLTPGRPSTNETRIPLSVMLWMLLPIAFLASLRNIGVLEQVVFTMSGDGRNHFIITQDIRIEGRVSLGFDDLGSPRLSNGLAALLSAASGSRGTLQVGDLVAISFVYLFSFVLLLANAIGLCLHFLSGAAKKSIRMVWYLAVPFMVIFILLSERTLGAVLNDGFFSLMLGSTVLSSVVTITYFAWQKPSFWLLGFQWAGLFVLAASYSLLVPAIVPVAVIVLLKFILFRWSKKNLIVIFAFLTFIMPLAVFVGFDRYYARFMDTINLEGGAVQNFDARLGLMIIASIVLWQLYEFAQKRTFSGLPFLLFSATTVLVVGGIEILRESQNPGFSYYSNKILIANAWALSPVFMILLIKAIQSLRFTNSTGIRWSHRFLSIAGALLASLVLVNGFKSINLPSVDGIVPQKISNGWSQPDIESVRPVISRWTKEATYFLVWNLSDNPPKVIYPSVWEDRIANFWSPVTWNGYIGGGFSTIWAWIYFSLSSNETDQLCPALSAMPLTILTKDVNLESSIKETCPNNESVIELIQ